MPDLSLVQQRIADSKGTLGKVDQLEVLHLFVVFDLRFVELLGRQDYHGVQLHILDPLSHALALPDLLVRLVIHGFSDGLDAVFLVQQEVLQLFFLYRLFLTPFFHALVLLFVQFLAMQDQSIAESLLLAQLVHEVTLALSHLELELAKVVLLDLHLLPHLDQGRLRVFLQARSVDENLFLARLSFAFRVGEFDPDVDRAAFYRQEADVNVASFKYFGLLVLRVDEEDVLREVTVVAAALLRLFLLLAHVDSQVFV